MDRLYRRFVDGVIYYRQIISNLDCTCGIILFAELAGDASDRAVFSDQSALGPKCPVRTSGNTSMGIDNSQAF